MLPLPRDALFPNVRSPQQAKHLMDGLDWGLATKEICAAAAFLKKEGSKKARAFQRKESSRRHSLFPLLPRRWASPASVWAGR